MATFNSVAATGKSIERLLTRELVAARLVGDDVRRPSARLVRTEDFSAAGQPTPFVSIFLYRIDFNRTMRAAWSGVGAVDGRSHLPLDLHFLLTAWGDSPELEYRLLGRAMQVLEETPILTGPLLVVDDAPAGAADAEILAAGAAGWSPNESIQIVLEDMTTDTVMRIFDSLQSNYKLSVPYTARVVRIDGAQRVRPIVQTSEIKGRGTG